MAANPQTWIEVRSPNFIVVTNANDKQARRAAYQFELIRSVFREYFGKTGPSTDPPITIIAAKDEGTLKALLPEFWTKKGSMHPAGMFLGSEDANYVGLRLDVSLNESAYEPYEPVYHEYVHYLTRHLRSQLPLWMVEGLAEFYGNTRIENDRVFVGAPSTSNLRLLRQTHLLPINTLFDVDASSPFYHEESKTSIFYAESWALTHYLMARDWNEKTSHVTLFVTLLGKGVNQREAARLTIGDPGSLEPVLRQYVQSHLFTAVRQDLPKIDESCFQARRMSDAESLAVRADFMAHDHHCQEAQQMLDEALKEDPKLGAACESMSSLHLAQGNFLEASKWASEALNLNPQSPRANYYVALTLMAGGVRDEQALSKAESSLRTALKSNAEFTPAYDLLAYVLSQPGPAQKLDEAYMATVEAVSREPSNVRYRIRAVDVQERRGRAEDAIRVAELAIPLAKTPVEKAMAEASLASAKQFSKNPLMSPVVEDVRQKLNENLNKDNNAKTDLEHDVAALTKLLDAGDLDVTDDAAARYFRASAQTLMNVLRKKDGLTPDTAINEQFLSDLDRIIAAKTDIIAWGITRSEVAYTAGTIAWNGLHSPRTYSYWQLCLDAVPCMVNLASGYTLGWEGVQPDPAKALELDLKAFDTGTKYRCAGAYAAHNIAGLIYFAGASYPKDNDPVSWTQKSYALSDPIEAQPNSENACDGAGTRMDEFLYRLARGDRRNNLLTDAVQRYGDKATTAPALAKYLLGSLDAAAFQEAVESSKSEFGRCFAYFHAMWYAFIVSDTALVSKFYEPLSKLGQATCPYYLVYAKKFHPEATQKSGNLDPALTIKRNFAHPMKEVGKTTINRYLATLRKALRYACRKQKLIAKTPLIELYNREDGAERQCEYVFSASDYQVWLSAAREPLRSASVLAHDGGICRGELLALQRDCVNLRDSADERGFWGTISIRRGLKRKDRRRDLPITEDMAAVLLKLLSESKCEYVFTSLHDHAAPLSANTLANQHRDLKRSCQFHPDAGIHALRHTFLTEAGRHTQNVRALQKLAGHSKIETTMRYIHPDEADLLEIASAVQEARLKRVTTFSATVRPPEVNESRKI